MAGVAAGAFADLSAAKDALVRKTGSFTPNSERHIAYTGVYKRYEKLYNVIRPLV